MSTTQKDNRKEPNDIRIGMNSRPRNVIKYSTSVMDEKKLKALDKIKEELSKIDKKESNL